MHFSSQLPNSKPSFAGQTEAQAIFEERTRRLNAKEAAAALNVSPWTIYAMKKSGAPFFGRYCTLADLDAWWRAHPEFCASRVWRGSSTSKTALDTCHG